MLRIRESPVFLERARQNLPLFTSSVELDRLNEVQLREFTAALIKDLKAKQALIAQEPEPLRHETSNAQPQKPKRQALPADLLRREVRREPTQTVCTCGCPLKRIGEDVAEKLDYTTPMRHPSRCSVRAGAEPTALICGAIATRPAIRSQPLFVTLPIAAGGCCPCAYV